MVAAKRAEESAMAGTAYPKASAADQLWSRMREDGEGTCARCAAPRPLVDLLVMYRVPLGRGGVDAAANVVVVCRDCGTAPMPQ